MQGSKAFSSIPSPALMLASAGEVRKQVRSIKSHEDGAEDDAEEDADEDEEEDDEQRDYLRQQRYPEEDLKEKISEASICHLSR